MTLMTLDIMWYQVNHLKFNQKAFMAGITNGFIKFSLNFMDKEIALIKLKSTIVRVHRRYISK